MHRREVLKAGASAAALAAAGPLRAQGGGTDALYDRILADMLKASPQLATSLGLDTGADAALKRRLDDRGPAAKLNAFQPLADAAAALARAPAEQDARRRQWLATARWFADAAQRMTAFDYGLVDGTYPVPYAVSQLTGAYVAVPDFLASQHTIASAADCEAYIARLEAFAPVIEQDTARMRADAGRGVVPPDFICDRALAQLKDLAADRGPTSGMAKSLADRARAANVPGDWAARAGRLIDGPIAAALARQSAAVAELRTRAKPTAGVRAQPQGDAFYAMALRFHTTTERTPAEVHRIGLDEVKRLTAEADTLLRGQGRATGTVVQRMDALSKDPSQLFPNTDAGRAQLLDYVRERTEEIKRRMPAVFSRQVRTPMEVRRVPPATELGAPGAYSQGGSLDGTRPGAIYFNLASTANWPRYDLTSTVYHEGYPGHHYQGALVNETPGVPALMKLLSTSAYGEGWALYAEQVAAELGAYEARPIDGLGRIKQSLFRGCRLVVDTGMHALGWSREQSIAFLVEQGGLTTDDARRETERYVVWPGQACSYKMGQLEFLRLREQARARMGARFDIKGFHDAVLGGGGMPLSVMDEVVRGWSGA